MHRKFISIVRQITSCGSPAAESHRCSASRAPPAPARLTAASRLPQVGHSPCKPRKAAKAGPCRGASRLLAFCDMATLYLRGVPDDVVERLKRLAEREGSSVNAVAVRELADSSRRADNPALLGALPDLGVDPATIAADLDAERATR